MTPELKQFIKNNKDLMNQNTKESWEEIYNKLKSIVVKGEFTKTILDAGINDPAGVMGYIPRYYLYKSKIESYRIPDNVTSIRDSAFNECKSLANIIISNSVTSIGNRAFQDCWGLTSVTIPDSVTSIDEKAFNDCRGLTSITIPDSVTSIGDSAFEWCESLTSVEIPSSVTSINEWAFRYCRSLTSVTIPSSVMSIGEAAFRDCYKLTEIKFKGTRREAIKCGIGNKSKKKWRENSPIKKIICNDGVIEL